MFKPNCLIITIAPEICLKSTRVRLFHEKFLKKNILSYLEFEGAGFSQILVRSGRMYLFTEQTEKALATLKNCFGIYKMSLAKEEQISSVEEVVKIGSKIGVEKLVGTFAVRAKSFDQDVKSKKIEELLGAEILKQNPNLKVNLSKPNSQLNVILLGKKVYFYFEEVNGAQGMPIGTQGIAALIGENKKELKKIAFSLLKSGCRVVTVDSELRGLDKWNNCIEIKDISLEEAKESYSFGRIKAFFCDGKTEYEVEKIEKLVETKPFAPLFCVEMLNISVLA